MAKSRYNQSTEIYRIIDTESVKEGYGYCSRVNLFQRTDGGFVWGILFNKVKFCFHSIEPQTITGLFFREDDTSKSLAFNYNGEDWKYNYSSREVEISLIGDKVTFEEVNPNDPAEQL